MKFHTMVLTIFNHYGQLLHKPATSSPTRGWLGIITLLMLLATPVTQAGWWNALGTGMDNNVQALAFDSSGNLYAGGLFTTAGGTLASRIEGTGQGRVVSTTKGVDDQGIDCASATQPLGCQANFVPATSVILLPIPDDGSAFSSWGGHPDCNKESLFITGGVLCTAYFRTLIHPFTLTINGRGTVTGEGLTCTGNICTGNYLEGTTVTLQTRPRPSWTFAGWSGDCDSQGTVTVTTTTQCQVTFLDDLNIPNQGDSNGDGTKDAEQENVASLPDTVSGN